MSDSPLCVAFLWHMHQPYYKDASTGIYRLPWVRLHGTKDYVDMPLILKDFPGIKQNFNLVPSLLEQVIDYTDHGATDIYLDLSRKQAADLTEEEKGFILENFFLAHWDNMIRPFPRYYELLSKRGTRLVKADLQRLTKYFTTSDFLDLQVLFNLCWIDPLFRQQDPFLAALCEKKGGFTEEEKATLLMKQMEIVGRIIPTYREMSVAGQIELSCSPYFHPILPLLCDTDIARVAMPQVRLPMRRFAHAEDAETQIKRGLDYFESIFGSRPAGMWPSEGSVSEEVVKIAARHGIQWMATDEGVLSGSLGRALRDGAGNLTEPSLLYRPHMYEQVSLIFRDHVISDLIGFVYSQWEPKRAADDLINRLLGIRQSGSGQRLVSIILDGENAWEHYRNDGRDFFLYLYEALSKEKRIRTVTVSEYLQTVDRGGRLDRLHPGSWINSNFGIWIGHEEDNMSWDYLTNTRERLAAFQQQNPAADTTAAWKAIYAAEGSDWNWWYGEDHTTETQDDFDDLFRLNLMKVFREMGHEAPAELFVPILQHDRRIAPTLAIRGFIQPAIDGIVTSYYEWYQGAEMDVKKSGGSMHKSEGLITTIHYGFNKDALFLRLDPAIPFGEFDEGSSLSIATSKPRDLKIVCPVRGEHLTGRFFAREGDEWVEGREVTDVAVRDVFEIALPFADLGAGVNEEINLFISVVRNGEELERCPWRGFITVTVPTPEYEAMMWY